MSLCNSVSPTLVILWWFLTFSMFLPCSLYFSLSHTTHSFPFWITCVLTHFLAFYGLLVLFLILVPFWTVDVSEDVRVASFIVWRIEVVYWRLQDCGFLTCKMLGFFFFMNRAATRLSYLYKISTLHVKNHCVSVINSLPSYTPCCLQCWVSFRFVFINKNALHRFWMFYTFFFTPSCSSSLWSLSGAEAQEFGGLFLHMIIFGSFNLLCVYSVLILVRLKAT